MARKIHIDSDNTIQQWIDSQNTMSDFMGNLDSFRPDIINAFDSDANVSSGTSFVTALNYIYNPLLTRILNIFNGTGAINIGSLELMIESATINVLKLENHDSGLKLGDEKPLILSTTKTLGLKITFLKNFLGLRFRVPTSSTNSTYLIEVPEQDISKPYLALPFAMRSEIASSLISKTNGIISSSSPFISDRPNESLNF